MRPEPYYSADGITLYQGDNREVLLALIAAGIYRPEDVALLWGDPPYGMRAVERRNGARAGQTIRKWSPVAGDDAPFDPAPWLIYQKVVMWGANYYAHLLPPSESWWIWDKKCKEWECDQADAELAWTNVGGVPRVFRRQWLGGHGGEGYLHPTQKPVALARWGFERAKLQPGDLVLSPWLGSGPEAVAARDMGLRFIGVELDRGADGKPLGYLDACVARLRQRTLFAVARPPEPEQAGLFDGGRGGE